MYVQHLLELDQEILINNRVYYYLVYLLQLELFFL